MNLLNFVIIYEIYDKNLICAFFVKQKLIFWNIKENKNFKSFKFNYYSCKIWDYDNIIRKNNKFYVGNFDEILIINLDTFEIETKIKLKYRLNCFCFYNLSKNKVLAAMNNNIFIIDSKTYKFSNYNEITGNPIKFEKINDKSFRLITDEGIYIFKK